MIFGFNFRQLCKDLSGAQVIFWRISFIFFSIDTAICYSTAFRISEGRALADPLAFSPREHGVSASQHIGSLLRDFPSEQCAVLPLGISTSLFSASSLTLLQNKHLHAICTSFAFFHRIPWPIEYPALCGCAYLHKCGRIADPRRAVGLVCAPFCKSSWP